MSTELTAALSGKALPAIQSALTADIHPLAKMAEIEGECKVIIN